MDRYEYNCMFQINNVSYKDKLYIYNTIDRYYKWIDMNIVVCSKLTMSPTKTSCIFTKAQSLHLLIIKY